MTVRRGLGVLLALLGVSQLLAVPGYYHDHTRILAVAFAAALLAAGYVLFDRMSAGNRA